MARIAFAIVAIVALMASQPDAKQQPTAAAEAFQRLKTLVGTWEGKLANGRTIPVSFKLTAGETVLVETWRMSPKRESMTMYHLDDDALILTHYCPQGNQPRLKFTSTNDGKMTFKFFDGTNLQNTKASHQHAVWIQIRDDKSFVRSETYVKNGSTAEEIAKEKEGEAVTFFRVEAKVQ